MSRRSLVALDFDGTLAPIVERPQDARVAAPVAERLRELVRLCPVAVISGRAIDDVTPRLAFSPRYVVGNHGAEGGPASGRTPSAALLDPVRARLARHGNDIATAGIFVEDKGLSIALHYRHAADHRTAERCIDVLTQSLEPGVRCFGGKCVVNIVLATAPDKADALLGLVKESGAHTALFIGDDVNDEPVFERALPEWVTVRVGRDDPTTQARFFMEDQAEMVALLDRILWLLARRPGDNSPHDPNS